MLGAGLPAVDTSPLLQLVLAALLLFSVVVLLVRRAASQYFVVDGAGFGEAAGREGYDAPRRAMSIGDSSVGGGANDRCASCGGSATKKCARCKGVRYCSQACQSKHWKADHKLKCKQLSSPDEVEFVSSRNGPYRRRKAPESRSISLVPARGTCKVLQEPKKILFPYDEFLKLFNWDKPGFLPCGLMNCGNSCFANVVLQCLTFTRPLTAYLLERDHSRECVRKQDDWCFLCELQVHVQRASERSHPIQPMNILSRLPHIGGNLGYGRQEDAHEFMRFAIDTMQSVCLDEFGGEKALDPSTQETTLIQHIFGGHLRSQVICTNCNMVSNRYENMMDLTVEIHGDAESLEECLEQFTVKEWLDGENKYKCDGCNDYVKAWKRLTVHQAPNILTVALKRFQSGRFGKLNKRVTFPEYLDLTPYMSGNADGSDLYSLYAVVVHIDMLNASFFGHYICYIKDFNGRWYKIDDCKVMNVDVEDVLAEGAYMLLYSRKSARREPFIKPMDPPKEVAEVVPKVASSADIPCLHTDVNTRPVATEASMQRDTELDGKLSADIDCTKDKELEGTDLDAPVEAETMPVRTDLGDLHGDAHEPKVANPISITCLPVGDNTQSTPTESSVPKETGLNEKLSADIDHGKDKELEDMDLDAPVEADSMSIHEDLGAVHKVAHSPSVASPFNISCVPAAVFMQPGLTEVSMLRDAGLGEKLSADIHNTRDQGSEGMDLDAPVEAHSMTTKRNLGDAHRDACAINFTTLKGPEEVNSSLSSVEVDIVKCQESFLSSDADSLAEEGNSTTSILESSEVLNNTLDHSVTGQNFVHKIVDTPSNAQISTASFVLEPSDDLRHKQGNVVAACSPSDSASEVYKSLPTCRENGFSRKPKPLFARGFLDRPAGKKSVDNGVESPTESCGAALRINGYSNGHVKIGAPKQEDNVASPELSPKSKDFGADGGVSFVSRGFLERSYKRSSNKDGVGRKPLVICETNCNGSADLSPLGPSDRVGIRLETSSSNGAAVIETKENGFSDAASANENGCRVYEKNRPSTVRSGNRPPPTNEHLVDQNGIGQQDGLVSL